MGRGKTPMGLIGDRRKRAAALASRKKGLMKMASELSTLCNVPVAVVLVGPVVDGAPPHHRPPLPEVWESEQGVVDRYRALPAEKRAEHTHLRYLEGNLGKENTKLARVLLRGPATLAPPDAELNGMSLDELRELLESVDAALLATAERKKTLGLPEHDDDYAVGVGGAPCTGGGGGGYYEMAEPDHQAIWEDANAMNMMQPGYYGIPNMNVTQPACDARGYMLDMAPVIAHPAYGYGGFQYTDGYDAGMGSSQMQMMPSNVDDNLAMWRSTAEPCNAVVPAGWYTDMFADNSLYSAPGCLGMGDAGDAMNYVDCNDMQYCSSNDFQWSGTSTSQNSSNLDDLHYLRVCLE